MPASVDPADTPACIGGLASLVGRFHRRWVHSRRVRILADAILGTGPVEGAWLDIGCGDGRLARAIMDRHPQLRVRGLDVLPRADSTIETAGFDGRHIESDDDSFAGVLLVDVLHHTTAPAELLTEAVRVARRQIIVKDHYCEGPIDRAVLRFMDAVGNRPHGVACPGNYLSRHQWSGLFGLPSVHRVRYVTDFRLYPYPFCWLFDAGLHFIAVLELAC